MDISIIIPVYNEEHGITATIDCLQRCLARLPASHRCEIIVVDDGSCDRTGELLGDMKDITVIRRGYNAGYGAAIKSGVHAARYDWIFLLDGDGQHRPDDLSIFTALAEQGYDAIIGARQPGSCHSWLRAPGKKLMTMTASYLANMKIPDTNSGMRLFRRDIFLKYLPIYPNGFSITTTMTLAFLGDGHAVGFVPITTHARLGRRSSVKIVRDGLSAIVMIIRTISLFNPLKVFLPAAVACGLVGLVLAGIDLIRFCSIPKSGILMLLGSLLIFLFGILCDQIALLRRSQGTKADR